MKYIIILVVVVVLVRIDVILSLFDKASTKMTKVSDDSPVDNSGEKNDRISFKDDQNLKQSPRQVLFSILTEFISDPSPANHARAMELIKSNLQLFTATLDPELETVIFRWRDLLLSKHSETILFLNDLQTILLGENLNMVRRFMSLSLDNDPDYFLKFYPQTKDKLCTVAILIADDLPTEERQNTLYDREGKLNTFLTKEGLDPGQKLFAMRCLALIRQELDKLNPPPPAAEVTPPPTETL